MYWCSFIIDRKHTRPSNARIHIPDDCTTEETLSTTTMASKPIE
jgi:hypothetical protein